MKTFYYQKLPHINPAGATYFVTFRLLNSIPKTDLQLLKDEYYSKLCILQRINDIAKRNSKIFDLRKRYLESYEILLHEIDSGPMILAQKEVMEIVKEQIHRFDNEFYNLVCYSVMSNHVHILIETNNSEEIDMISEFESELFGNHTHLSYIMQRIKGATARYINKELNQRGGVWEKESYDMYIRNEKMMNNVISYILYNPVKSGLVVNWEMYVGNYLKLA